MGTNWILKDITLKKSPSFKTECANGRRRKQYERRLEHLKVSKIIFSWHQHSTFPGKNKTTCHMTTSASLKRRTRRLWRRKAAWFLRPLRRADIITTLYRYRSLASLSWASKSCLYCSVSCFHSIPLCFSLCIKIVADNPFVLIGPESDHCLPLSLREAVIYVLAEFVR